MLVRKEDNDTKENIINEFKHPKMSKNMAKYKLIDQIGKGTYGTVSRYKDMQDNLFAIKKFTYKDQSLHITTVREIMNLIKMGNYSKYVVEIHEIIIYNNFIHLVFPLYETTLEMIKLNGFSHLKDIFKQIVQGVCDIHDQGIIHRDLKPNNIMLTYKNTEVKIIDFGMSRKLNNKMSGLAVTLIYRAPELLKGTFDYKQYGLGVDVWSLGIILIELIIGRPPFEMDTNEIKHLKDLDKIVNKEFDKYFKFIKDENLINLIQLTLKWDPVERISATEILEHPFFTKQLLDDNLPLLSKDFVFLNQ